MSIKKILANALIFFSLVFSLSPALVLADAQSDVQCGINGAAGVSGCAAPVAPGTTLNNTASNVINILSLVGGALAVIMLIVGGLRYTSSAGNPEAAKGAKNTILYALIGLLVVAVAQIIVHFVLHNVTTTIK